MFRRFFQQQEAADSLRIKNQDYCIQVPSTSDLEQMHGMPAGATEDQYHRLKHMTEVIAEIHSIDSALPVMDTDQVCLPDYWEQLFIALKQGEKDTALSFFAKIPKEDMILKALLAVHTVEYVQQIMSECLKAHATGKKISNSDIVITPRTLEVLIKDIATTLLFSGTIHFSFGLPTHHAFKDEGSGFCILNKTALLIHFIQSLQSQPLTHIIIGTDVNRDNGLCEILMNSASTMDVCHIDIFDSRVYPQQDHRFITDLFKSKGTAVGQEIYLWHSGTFQYFAVDLSKTMRQPGTVHPALIFALEQMEAQIKQAKEKGHKVALFLPTGWDSHQDETAYCGKFIKGRFMSPAEAKKMRFSHADLTYFYESFFELYREHKDDIERIYWGLEGGYDRSMYEHQIRLLMSLSLSKLAHQEIKPMDSKHSKGISPR